MPNQPKTPLRSFRISDELYAAARDKAKGDGYDLSTVVRELLQWYVGVETSADTSASRRRRSPTRR